MKKSMIWGISLVALTLTGIIIYRRSSRPKNHIQIMGVIAELKDSWLSLPTDPKRYADMDLSQLSELKRLIQQNNQATKDRGYGMYTQSPDDQALILMIQKINSPK